MNKFIFYFIVLFLAGAILNDIADAEVKEIYLTPHFHYDPVFVKDQDEYTDVGFDRVRRFLACLAADPDYAVVFSEIDYLKPFFDTFPEERERILELVAENKIETGGSYNEPNEMSVGEEGLIRNIIYGRAWHEGVLGDRRAGVYMPFDVFGHTLQLSQILSKTRYKGAVWRKGNPPAEKWTRITVPGLPPDFMNLAPDGSLLRHRREHYKAVSGTVSEEDLLADVMKKKELQEKLGLEADFGLLSSDDFAYPETWLAGKCGNLKKSTPPVIISGPSAYFDALERQDRGEKSKLPVVARDFSLYHAGTALSRVNLKIGNRLAEVNLLGAEKFGTVAMLLGAEYPEAALDKAWRQLLFNQHHDGITGTSCDRSYFDMMAGFREALELGTEAYIGAARFIAANIGTVEKPDGTIPVVVLNQLGWRRTDFVVTGSLPLAEAVSYRLEDGSGKIVEYEKIEYPNGRGTDSRLKFIAEGIPSAGYKTYYLVPGEKRPDSDNGLSAEGNTISNEFYSVTVDPGKGGGIIRLLDLESGKAVIGADTKFPGNELVVLKEDEGPEYPAWELSTVGVKSMSSGFPAAVEARKNGMEAKLIARGELPGLGTYIQEIRLYRKVKRIDFLTTVIEPQGPKEAGDRNLWMVRFPAELRGTAPVIEDRFYAAARRRSLKPLEYRTDLEKMNTLSAPYSALRWVEEGTGVRVDIHDRDDLVTDAISIMLCEIVHTGSEASTGAARELQEALLRRGVTCTPSYHDEDRNRDLLNRNFRFVIDLDGDNAFAKSVTEGKESGERFRERIARDGSALLLLSVKTKDLNIREVDTLIIGADGDGNLGKRIAAISQSIREIMRIDLKEFEDSRIGVKKTPPDDYGTALINRGNLLHSFDAGGAIVMGLFHSAQWAKSQMGIPFAFPEEKNHRFIYSLYPHEGDWRDADTYRTAHDVNSPLIAVAGKGREGGLKETGSFLEMESGSTVLSAMKAAGNPLAGMRTGVAANRRDGIILRVYEAEGRSDRVKIRFFRPIETAVFTNMLEEPVEGRKLDIKGDNEIEFEIGPNSVETILLKIKEDERMPEPGASIARDSEGTDILYSNYWDYNLGAAYMGNSPVSIDLGFPLERKLPDPELIKSGMVKQKKNRIGKGENLLRLSYANNSVDERLKGSVKIEVPESWKAEPWLLDVDLAPKEGKTVELKVTADRPESGFIRAVMETEKGNVFDVIEIGETAELDAVAVFRAMENGCGSLALKIRNNQGGRITGSASIIGPVETWPPDIAGEYSLVSTGVSHRYFDLEKDEAADIDFSICDTAGGVENEYFWQMVKITYNGKYRYIPLVNRE